MAKTIFNTDYTITRGSSVNQRSGRYLQGGTTDIVKKRLGWWERTQLVYSETDVPYVVEKDTEFRPDLIAYRVYRQTTLAWLVLQYNNIIDINTELTTGTLLRLPTPSRVNFELLAKSV